MSCKNCDLAQEKASSSDSGAFIRVGNGNLLVVGCKTHIMQLLTILRNAKDKEH